MEPRQRGGNDKAAHKRPCNGVKRMKLATDQSVFGDQDPDTVAPVTPEDAAVMVDYCEARGLPVTYSGAALQLWSRVKRHIKPQHHKYQMLMALHVALKFQSQDDADCAATLAWVRRDFPGVTKQNLFDDEIQMCVLLKWRFR